MMKSLYLILKGSNKNSNPNNESNHKNINYGKFIIASSLLVGLMAIISFNIYCYANGSIPTEDERMIPSKLILTYDKLIPNTNTRQAALLDLTLLMTQKATDSIYTDINTILEVDELIIDNNTPNTAQVDYLLDINMPKEHQEYLFKLCEERNLNYIDALSIVKHESQFDSNAIGGGEDYGYFQVNVINHDYLSNALDTANAPLDPYVNINWGTYIIADLYSYWQSKGLDGEELYTSVLSSYNKGINGYRKHGAAINYISKVATEKEYLLSIFSK